jgi:hypothetical protein
VLSSQIEGTQSSLSDLLLFEIADGIVREVTARHRNRQFVYDGYLRALEGP